MSTFEQAIPLVLTHEGGWVRNPKDLGGETNYGISTLIIEREGITAEELGLDPKTKPPARELDAHGHETPASAARTAPFIGWLKPMKVGAAVGIYRRLFWERFGYGQILDQTCASKVFDFAVNAGGHHAAEVAQRAALVCGQALDVDGSLGPVSFKALNAVPAPTLVRELAHQMARYYEGCITARPENEAFRSNWMKRAAWGV